MKVDEIWRFAPPPVKQLPVIRTSPAILPISQLMAGLYQSPRPASYRTQPVSR